MFSVNTAASVILLRNRIWMICCPKDLCCELFCMIGNQRIFILSATFTQKLENFVWVITGKYLSHVFFDGHLLPLFGGSGSTTSRASMPAPMFCPRICANTRTRGLCAVATMAAVIPNRFRLWAQMAMMNVQPHFASETISTSVSSTQQDW